MTTRDEHLAILKVNKEHWHRGPLPVTTAGLRTVEFVPLKPRPLPFGIDERMAAYRAIPSLYR